MNPILLPEDLTMLSELDTPTIANVIETFNLRLRNEGYTNSSITCRFPHLKPMVGYALTLRMRAHQPPVKGRVYADPSDWWEKLEDLPKPRIAVIQDLDNPCGAGALAGTVHGAIFKMLGCVGIATNGAVRALPSLEASGLQVYSGKVSPTHAYAHVIDFGESVEIGGLAIEEGDLLHGDMHGIIKIPQSIAGQISKEALKMFQHEKDVKQLCSTTGLSLDQLRHAIEKH
ncbi:MAG TPA: RraA family protein [Nitrospiria bacterium]|nr:RraA family protein [Nitrospiria bacterium]